MSNRREKMREAHGGGSDFVKLDVAMRYDLKDDESGNISFSYYSREEEKHLFSRKPIEGILIGSANIMSAYDDDLGTKGGTYMSSPYFTNNDHVALFAPGKSGYDVVFRGLVSEAEAWINANSTSQRATKRKVLYVLNLKGIISIITNMTIAIDQMRQVQESLLDNFVKLTPRRYNPDSPNISKKAQDILGKFARKNPPKYANIELSGVITDESYNTLKGDEVLDKFLAWKKSISVEPTNAIPSVKTEPEPVVPRQGKVSNVDYEKIDRGREAAEIFPKRKEEVFEEPEYDNDLPF